ncbi:TetR/AcrR family transcriptional regulator [Microbacterium sp. Sa4CUA7]|uniref:TetR/AcrR family transcriptional regulator n=1 Tax=Microbacterium pullorum TaxID=2762236 RepID=A0ABR8RZ20_9MICO|nr:TetR/AcrR family transcriptional regulator [Microbacterium pullorum]MBD7956484.1 TetR/AcrR family transcriptional regulator [Microbacterium pullorum]
MPPTRSSTLSTAEARRPLVAAAAMAAFARRGYYATTVADVAREAKISPAYVFKLYAGKEGLFVAALEACFDAIIHALDEGADAAVERTPGAILDAMGDAYARLISDRTLLMLQVHAQSVADIPEIGAALRSGLGQIITFAQTRSSGTDEQVQRFIAYGQLCHLIVTAQLDGREETWAALLTRGISHPE